jgi:histidinol-phosphate aminotransferase
MMKHIADCIPEYLRKVPGYTPGKPLRQAERESGVHSIKMASNENPFGPSPRALAAAMEAASQANFYPDNEVSELRLKIAASHGVGAEHVCVGNGSTALLDTIARTLLAPGLNAITSRLSFIVYPIATKAAGGEFVQVALRDGGFDLPAIAQRIDEKTRIVYLANPNNPTGTMFDAAALDRFLGQVPEHVLVLLDEAYCDFAEAFASERGVEYSRSLEHVKQGRHNLMVLRTFSKAHGLAGLRIGYAVGDPRLVEILTRVRITFAVSNVSQAAAIAALDDTEHVRAAVENNLTGARLIGKALAEMGLPVPPTWANFVFVEMGESAENIARRLQDEGVIVRPLTAWGAPHAMRVTIGTPAQNQMFLSAFRKVMAVPSR